jgi:type II secretion system protein G
VLKHLTASEDWNQKSLGAKGFTLIELLVVIVILGVLAAVVVFSISGITDNSETSACEQQKRTIETAVEAYRAEEGAYPAGVGNLVPGFLRETPSNKWGTVTVSGSTVGGITCP